MRSRSPNPPLPSGPDSPAPAADWSHLFADRTARAGGALTAILALAGSRETITFSGGFPAREAFPVDLLRRLLGELLDEDPATALQYSPTEGLPIARAAVAGLLGSSQGIAPDPGDVLITSGGIEALQLVCRVLLERGDEVAVEAPTYLGALMSFGGFRTELCPVQMDDGGICVEAFESLLGSGSVPKLLYVIPDHQNPTGISMSPGRRRALVESCRSHGVLIVEDVAYRYLGFEGDPPPSLWSLGPDVVLQIGTFSKILFPGVRLGWAVGPAPLLKAMTAAKQNSDQCAGALGQALMERFVSGGHLEAHLVAARALYAGRAAAMLAALEREMPEGIGWTRPKGGFFVWLTAPPGTDTEALAAEALRHGVAYVPGPPFYAGGEGTNQLRLAYSGVVSDDIDEGIARLARLFGGEVRKSA